MAEIGDAALAAALRRAGLEVDAPARAALLAAAARLEAMRQQVRMPADAEPAFRFVATPAA